MEKKKVYLTLQNGKALQGYAFGAEGDITGELTFSTGMVGYLETLTDPANYGQIVVQTFPLIGNYGVMQSDLESDRAWVSAYVVREICDEPSNFRMEGKLEDYLKAQGVVGICGVDTRELTKILRTEGAMNARISERPLTDEEIKALASAEEKTLATVFEKQKKGYFAAENAKYTVALWDLGAKNGTVANLNAQGCNVVLMPASTTADELLSLEVDGVVIAGGPGDPKEYTLAIQELKKLLGRKPVFGLELGHLLVALALGGDTKKHKYGHRGSNQPVKCQKCGRVYITAQNHGYEIAGNPPQGEISFVNVNDGSREGVDYEAINACTVQFAPEACGIGVEINPVYEKFFAMMQKEKENA